MNNVGNNSRGRSQGVPKIFRAPMYRAHCAVIFAIAQLSCYITVITAVSLLDLVPTSLILQNTSLVLQAGEFTHSKYIALSRPVALTVADSGFWQGGTRPVDCPNTRGVGKFCFPPQSSAFWSIFVMFLFRRRRYYANVFTRFSTFYISSSHIYRNF